MTDLPPDATPLTVEQVAAMFGVTPDAILRWIHEGKLRASRPGKRYYVSLSAVRELLSGVAG